MKLKKLNDLVVDYEVVEKSKLKLLKTKVNIINKKIPEATTLIQINQQNAEKQILEKKMEMFMKNTRLQWFSDYNFS